MTAGSRADADHGHGHADHGQDHDGHDRGLAGDLPALISRRRAVGLLAGGIGTALAACGSPSGGTARDAATSTAGATTTNPAQSGAVGEIPDETAGPFPADGSNGPDVLARSGVVRSDIRRSIGDASGVAEGVPTRLELRLVDVAGGGPLAGAAVYVWHCDRDGAYSMYDASAASENYLRGVQASGDDGRLAFTTIFPALYPGRWPHIHFEVYESIAAATAGAAKLKTSQIALPPQTCRLAYASEGYERSAQLLAGSSLDDDGVFSDGYAGQLATGSGSVERGLVLSLAVGL